MLRIGINGLGRIGRTLLRVNSTNKKFRIVLVNELNPSIENMTYLIKYDSVYKNFPGEVTIKNNNLLIDNKEVLFTNKEDISSVPWSDNDVDIVIDSSGVSKNIISSKNIVNSENRLKVIVTHSSSDVDKEVVLGVNDNTLESNDRVVSNSICDANAISHFIKWINDEYEIATGSVTTLHPWLSYQNLSDGPAISQSNPGVIWPDFSLGRSSVGSLIPKNTTAVQATEKIIPEIKNKLLSMSFRIPTAIVGSSDITLLLNKTPEETKFREFLLEKIKNSEFVKANEESLVSVDYEAMSYSAALDMPWLKIKDNIVKLVVWYDNEWGYCSRVLDLAEKLSQIK
tara:strand:- start:1734 stop:2759 length:1026 start_codon:yes stop_codon:yes gene_type:complete